jgi:hypothetical protein
MVFGLGAACVVRAVLLYVQRLFGIQAVPWVSKKSQLTSIMSISLWCAFSRVVAVRSNGVV